MNNFKILYITYDPETSNYCGIYRASIEYINSIKLVYKNIDKVGINRFLESKIKNFQYDYVIIQTVLNDKVKDAIDKIKFYNRKTKIGLLVVYETENIPKSWLKFNYYAHFFLTPTYLMKNILINNNFDKPIYVIQHNIINKLTMVKKNIKKNNTYIFYTICKIDDPRKNIQNLLNCYLNTFTSDDNVLLYIKGYQNNKLPIIKKKHNSPKFKIDTCNVSDDEIIQIHQNCDCYISLAHSEGVGLGMLEASTIGNPVITTSYGGQMEYIKYGYFVKYKLDFININYSFFDSSQFWAYPEYKHATKIMRNIFNNPSEAYSKGIQNKEFVIENFNNYKIGNKYVNILKSI